MRKIDQLVGDFRNLSSWEEKIAVIRAIRSGRRTLIINNVEYKVGKTGVKSLKTELRLEVCEFNRTRKFDEPIRSVFTGEFLQPGSKAYSRSLNACKIVRVRPDGRRMRRRG